MTRGHLEAKNTCLAKGMSSSGLLAPCGESYQSPVTEINKVYAHVNQTISVYVTDALRAFECIPLRVFVPAHMHGTSQRAYGTNGSIDVAFESHAAQARINSGAVVSRYLTWSVKHPRAATHGMQGESASRRGGPCRPRGPWDACSLYSRLEPSNKRLRDLWGFPCINTVVVFMLESMTNNHRID